MTSGRIRNREEIEKIVVDLGYKFLNEYNKRGKRVVIQDSHGYKWDGNFSDFMSPELGIRLFSKHNIYTLENIGLWLKSNRSELELLPNNTYNGNTSKLKILHNIPQCQEVFEMNWLDISQGCGCSVCSGRQVGSRNNLAYLRPDLLREWHPDNKIKPENVTLGSHKKIYWICSKCGYGENLEWNRSCNDRIYYGCPSCSGRVVSDRNRLSTLYPDISAEWDYDKNKDTPSNVSYGSKKKRWWLCKENHSYFSSIKSRTRGSDCKQCYNEYKESKIATELKEWCKNTFKYVDVEHKMFKNPKSGGWLWCDIYIGEPKTSNGIYIEIHGKQHYNMGYFHKMQSKKNNTSPEEEFEKSKVRDKIKKKYAKENGIYIEIDLRKIKTTEEAIDHVEKQLIS